MLTFLQRQKITHYFNLIDIDNNGYMEPEDWVLIAKNLAEVRDIAPGTAEYDEILATADKVWSELSKYIESVKKGRASLAEWMRFADDNIVNGDDEWYENYVNEVVRGIFALMDEDKNGTIEWNEYVLFLSCFGISTGDARIAFEKLDLNGDGILDESEMISSVREFHKSSDPDSPGNWLFGPLK